jgi:hypothetical protein
MTLLVGDDVPDRVAVEFHGADTHDGGDGDDVISGGGAATRSLGGNGTSRIAAISWTCPGARDIIDAGRRR